MTFAGHSHSAAARAKVSAARAPAVLTARVSLAGFVGRTCQSEGARKLTADTTQLPSPGGVARGLRGGLGDMPWRPALCRVRRSLPPLPIRQTPCDPSQRRELSYRR